MITVVILTYDVYVTSFHGSSYLYNYAGMGMSL